jgi:hypothetical protein
MMAMSRYYEGKEFEAKYKEKKPGTLSEELKQALGMPPFAPPPWLINMQRYGPPPSYPSLKIPGLNAPIPYGYVVCSCACVCATVCNHLMQRLVHNGAIIREAGGSRLWTR